MENVSGDDWEMGLQCFSVFKLSRIVNLKELSTTNLCFYPLKTSSNSGRFKLIFIDRANFLCQNVKQKIRQDRNFLNTLICVSSRSKHNVSVSALRPFLWYSLNCIMETAVLESIRLIKISHFKPTVKWHNLGFWCHHRKEIKTFWLGRWLMWHQMS